MQKDPRIPSNHQTVMPYLIIPRAADFISFTEKVFGARETHKTMRDEKTIMHAEIRIGESTIMLADATETIKASPAGLFVYVPDADSTFKKAIDAGAGIVMEMADQPYGRSGGVQDPFGNTWWITSIK